MFHTFNETIRSHACSVEFKYNTQYEFEGHTNK